MTALRRAATFPRRCGPFRLTCTSTGGGLVTRAPHPARGRVHHGDTAADRSLTGPTAEVKIS